MPRVGIVLGAGGVTGDAFHRGVLRALHERGYDARDADAVVGTSAGAMVAAFLRRPGSPPAHHTDADETVHGRRLGRLPDLAPLLATLRRPWRARAGVVTTSLLPTGRHSTEFLVTGIRERHGERWPHRPTYICAVRRRDGRRVVFGRDDVHTDIARAVAASCAIPGYFHPVEIGGDAYVDGGVHSPTNADVLHGHDLDLLIVSSPMSVAPRGLRPTLDVGLRLYAHRYLRRELSAYDRAGVTVVTTEPAGELLQVMGVNPLHGARIDEIEEASCSRLHALLDARPDASELLTRCGRRRSA